MQSRASPLPAADVLAALQRGGVLEALKLVLAAKTAGLKQELKNSAGHVASPSRPPSSVPSTLKPSHLSPGEVPRSNKDIWLLLVLMLALYFFYSIFA